MTPMEVWSEKIAQNYDMIRIFGCPAYYHFKEDILNPRAKKTVFLGFKRDVKVQAVGIPKMRRLW